MANNTKFVGFVAGTQVVLERWGGREIVDLKSEEAVAALREACYVKLPKMPKYAERSEDFQFSPEEGIRGVFNMAHAERLLAILADVPNKDLLITAWCVRLQEAIQNQRDYLDMNEPGLPAL